MKKISTLIAILFLSLSAFSTALVSGVYCIGPSASYSPPMGSPYSYINGAIPYPTIDSALKNLNTLGASGDIIFELQNDYTSALEPISINCSYQGTASATLTVKVRNDLSTPLLLSKTSAGANGIGLIEFNNAKYVTIDTRINNDCNNYGLRIVNNQSSSNLSFTLGTTCISFTNDSKLITISGVQFEIADIGIRFDNNNTITNTGNDSINISCNLFKVRSNLLNSTCAPHGIWNAHNQIVNPTATSNDVTIENNKFENLMRGVYLYEGVSGNYTISNNHFYRNMNNIPGPNLGEFIQSSKPLVLKIDGNYFGGSLPFCAGAKMQVTPATQYLLLLTPGLPSNNVKSVLSNNHFENMELLGSTVQCASIQGSCVWDIIGNTFGNPIIANDISSTTNSQFAGVYNVVASNATTDTLVSKINNNSFNNISSSGNQFAGSFYGIYSQGPSASIKNNNFKNIAHNGAYIFQMIFSSNYTPIGGQVNELMYNTAENIVQSAASINYQAGIFTIENQNGLPVNWTCVGNRIGSLSNPNDIIFNSTSVSPFKINIWTKVLRADSNTICNVTCTNANATTSHTMLNIQAPIIGNCAFNTIFNIDSKSKYTTPENTVGIASLTGLGISNSGSNPLSEASIHHNKIYNLNHSNTVLQTAGISITGIAIFGADPNLKYTIFQNEVYGLSNQAISSGSNPFINGISYFGGKSLVHNNRVSISNSAYLNVVNINGFKKGYSYNQSFSFYHNSIAITGSSTIGSNSFCISKTQNTYGTDTMKNNIFYNSRTGAGSNYCLGSDHNTYQYWGKSDYNTFFSTDLNQLGKWLNTNLPFATWKTSTLTETNSFIKNVKFIDINNDLHLNPYTNCALNGAGLFILSVSLDMDNDIRNNPPDIGADEVVYIVPTVVADDVNPVCQGQSLNLTSTPSTPITPLTYSWSGPNLFSSAIQNPSISNVQAINQGNYAVIVTDAYDCSASGIVAIVLQNNTGSNSVTACDSFISVWGSTYYASGAYTHTYTNVAGCDSVHTLNLTINYSSVGSSATTACNYYLWEGTTYNTSGAYTHTYTNAVGCDSVHTLNLTINNSSVGSSAETTCNSYIWEGTTYNTNGAYTHTYTNAVGCDSVHTLNLTINNSSIGSSAETTCNSYIWEGTTYNTSGAYTHTYTNVAGCDSVHTLNLTINYSNTGSSAETACNSYLWEGTTYNTNGAYTHTYTNVAGCDSVHTLNLTINNSSVGSSATTACNSYVWEGITYNSNGAYTHTYTNVAGCDSVHTLNLTINNSIVGSSAITACNSYLWEGTTYNTSGAYTHTYTNTVGCDSVHTLNLIINNSSVGSSAVTTCNSYVWEGTTYNSSGAYTHTYTNVAGCDSVHTLTLTINNSSVGSSATTACNIYLWEGTTYNTSGAYTHTYTNAVGCDSIHTLNLTINNSSVGSSAETACNSYVWEGTTYNTSGAYTHTYTNAVGCDSVHTLNLTINNSSVGSSAITACNSYIWEGTTYNTNGAYTHTYTNTVGCDSVHTLNLTINNSNSGSSATTACNSYIWEGTTYNTSGAYTHTYTNVAGCDSVHTLNLTINYSNTGSSAVTTCNSYVWEGTTYNSSGAYTHTYTNVAGCDSVHTLNLTINNSSVGTSAVTTCNSYVWEGITYNASGAYTHTYTNVAGCDSVHTLNLTINNSSVGSSAVTTCNSYVWEGTTYNSSGAYTHTYTNVAGCDSVHTLNLTINNSSIGLSAETACNSYVWEGITYNASGAYTHTYTNAVGCDSVHTLNLTINNSSVGSSAITACNSYLWEGTTYNTNGAYTHTYTNVAGCDSLHTLNLTINNSNSGSSAVTTCNSYVWEGTTYNASGVYTHTYTNVAGCDSVHTLNLTINNANSPSTISITSNIPITLPYGQVVNTSGNYMHTFMNISGCDSIVNYIVFINANNNPISFSNCPSNISLPCVNGNGTIATWSTPTASILGNNCVGGNPIAGFTFMGNFGGHSYYKSNASNYTWIAARNAAIAAGGNLVSISNAQENNFVKGLVSNAQNGNSEAWIGLNDITTENNFVWSNGEPIIYTRWNSNEPNNIDGGNCCNNNQADYISINRGNGKWQDRTICETNEFIMELNCINPVTVVKIAGPNSGSLFTGNTTTTITYLAYTNSGDSAYCTFNVAIGACSPVYCNPANSSTSYEYINRVQFNTINNTSGNNNGYGNYTLANTSLNIGSTYAINLTPGFTNCTYTEYWKVYIDYNNDGDWNDVGEAAAYGNGTAMIVRNITIPLNAVTNVPLRMRVVMQWGSYPAGPCAANGCNGGTIWGETEDYTIVAINGSNKSDNAGIETINLNENNFSNSRIEMVSLYPNPVSQYTSELNLLYRASDEGKVNISIYDIKGSLISTQQVDVHIGENRSFVALNQLKQGVYFLHLSNKTGKYMSKFSVK